MKTLRTLFVIAIALVGFTKNSNAADPVFGSKLTATASAKVLTVLSITESQVLNFGSFGASADARTVVVATDDSRSSSSANLVATEKGAAAIFDILGEPTYHINFTIPTDVTTLKKIGDNTKTMTIAAGTWTKVPSDLSDILLDSEGKTKIKLGATLSVGAAQSAGSYTGTYEVTANYN